MVAIGTRFIATHESLSPLFYKKVLLETRVAHVVTIPEVTGFSANFYASEHGKV